MCVDSLVDLLLVLGLGALARSLESTACLLMTLVC